jgi:hypothetical protein
VPHAAAQFNANPVSTMGTYPIIVSLMVGKKIIGQNRLPFRCSPPLLLESHRQVRSRLAIKGLPWVITFHLRPRHLLFHWPLQKSTPLP